MVQRVHFISQMLHVWNIFQYLPTFALNITQMLVNIPYMEHMGFDMFIGIYPR